MLRPTGVLRFRFPFEGIALGLDFSHPLVVLPPSLFKRGLRLRNRVVAPFPLLFPDGLVLPALFSRRRCSFSNAMMALLAASSALGGTRSFDLAAAFFGLCLGS